MKIIKIIFIMMITSLLIGCTIQKDNSDDCLMGCLAGTSYNGTDFNELNITDSQTYETYDACQTFCNYLKNN